jgi:hypothetical protein
MHPSSQQVDEARTKNYSKLQRAFRKPQRSSPHRELKTIEKYYGSHNRE